MAGRGAAPRRSQRTCSRPVSRVRAGGDRGVGKTLGGRARGEHLPRTYGCGRHDHRHLHGTASRRSCPGRATTKRPLIVKSRHPENVTDVTRDRTRAPQCRLALTRCRSSTRLGMAIDAERCHCPAACARRVGGSVSAWPSSSAQRHAWCGRFTRPSTCRSALTAASRALIYSTRWSSCWPKSHGGIVGTISNLNPARHG